MKKGLGNNKNIPQGSDQSAKALILPPPADSGLVKAPTHFNTIGDVINEQKRLYKMVFAGELALSDLTKLMYSLQQIIQGFRVKSEIDALEEAYIKQWNGVQIIAPPGEPLPRDPIDVILEQGIVNGETQ